MTAYSGDTLTSHAALVAHHRRLFNLRHVQAMAQAEIRSGQAWRKLRPESDFAGFLQLEYHRGQTVSARVRTLKRDYPAAPGPWPKPRHRSPLTGPAPACALATTT
jgi:hypothetical protein